MCDSLFERPEPHPFNISKDHELIILQLRIMQRMLHEAKTIASDQPNPLKGVNWKAASKAQGSPPAIHYPTGGELHSSTSVNRATGLYWPATY